MLKKRIIPLMLINHGYLVQTRKFGLKQIIGKPHYQMQRYNQWSLDELLVLDISDVRVGQEKLHEQQTLAWFQQEAPSLKMPLTFGGNIRSIEQVENRIRSGAEKVLINRAAFDTPELIDQASHLFGQQAIVLGIDIHSPSTHAYEALNRSGLKLAPMAYAKEMVERGAGEIVINFMHLDGTLSGYDIAFSHELAQSISVPVVVCGGCSNPKDIEHLLEQTAVSAAGVGNMLYYQELSYPSAKKAIGNKQLIREVD